jgi:hypothetical protein
MATRPATSSRQQDRADSRNTRAPSEIDEPSQRPHLHTPRLRLPTEPQFDFIPRGHDEFPLASNHVHQTAESSFRTLARGINDPLTPGSITEFNYRLTAAGRQANERRAIHH